MANGKDVRITIILECNSCRKDSNKKSPGISRYITQKYQLNTPSLLELRKLSPLLQTCDSWEVKK